MSLEGSGQRLLSDYRLAECCVHVGVILKRYSSSGASASLYLIFLSAESGRIDCDTSWRGKLFAGHQLCQEKLRLLIFMLLLRLHLFLVLQFINLVLESQDG